MASPSTTPTSTVLTSWNMPSNSSHFFPCNDEDCLADETGYFVWVHHMHKAYSYCCQKHTVCSYLVFICLGACTYVRVAAVWNQEWLELRCLSLKSIYATWSVCELTSINQLLPYNTSSFNNCRLLKVINSSFTEPMDATTHMIWLKMDAATSALLTGCIKAELVVKIAHLATTNVAWDLLAAEFNQVSSGSIIYWFCHLTKHMTRGLETSLQVLPLPEFSCGPRVLRAYFPARTHTWIGWGRWTRVFQRHSWRVS